MISADRRRPRSLCIHIPQLFWGRVHIYFVSRVAVASAVVCRVIRDQRISHGNTLGHTHSHMHKHSQVPPSKETQRRSLDQATKCGEISKMHTRHTHNSVCARACACVRVVGVSGHYSNRHFPAEWDSDCSIFLKSDDATFHFSTF